MIKTKLSIRKNKSGKATWEHCLKKAQRRKYGKVSNLILSVSEKYSQNR